MSSAVTPESSTTRSPSATVCHERSLISPTEGAAGATKAPLPGLVTTLPSAASCPIALDTVTGLTPWRRMSSLLEGNRSPGRFAAIS
ncbi:hypothetical protein GCM10020219_027930 [Nonomuraea dietziae]